MFILEDTDSGYTFIEESTGDYYCAFYVDANGGTVDYPLVLGPAEDFENLGIPF